MTSSRVRQLLTGVIAVLLVFGLPLQSLTSVIASVLGARHIHVPAVAHVPVVQALQSAGAFDEMEGWRDFRRAQYDYVTASAEDVHEHSHATGQRHHHEPIDASVVQLEPSADKEGAAAEALIAAAGFVSLAAGETMPLATPVEGVGADWRAMAHRALTGPDPHRIERPPQIVC